MTKNKILFFIFTGFFSISNSQEVDIEKMVEKEIELEEKINTLQDSLKKVKSMIAFNNAQLKINNTKIESIAIEVKEGGKLREKPRPSGDILMAFEEPTKVDLIGYEDRYYEICLDNKKCGYVSHLWIESNSEIRKFVNKYQELKNLKIETAKLEEAKRMDKLRAEHRKRWDSIENEQEKRKSERENEILAKKELEEKRLLNKYGKKVFDQLKRGMYWIGMNKEQLTFSLGWPEDINRSVGSWGTKEQFVYSTDLYIYLENGVVTSYQN
ncbi:hypothetical protein [Salegentibacter salarius]|uniref:Uncharacterized protein n=1 Tax=Salegentibacter salarius TaxID=435906 RepID=A0A2N0TVY4_9FLAO|nr:hypothetical protein [Salegentibacter salarius]OEY72628.1 hypothetical protein BHS39_12030 [Salegentibacter salarius]PKD18925.1 hypothetical protein APR40_12005 [Salegentibacter salarius]SLK01477.1 hypothetical protein SAMN05660445_02492 [Salegentibacter salarius]